MRLAATAYLIYASLRGVLLLLKPEKAFDICPGVNIEAGTQEHTVAVTSSRAIAVLILASGMLSFGGTTGRFLSFGVIFPLFYYNHFVLEVASPPIIPVVVANIVAFAANIYEHLQGGSDKSSAGKWAYFLMQSGFGAVFVSEQDFLVQDPFDFAVTGSDSLLVGKKLGFVIGFVLCMHAAMTICEPPFGCVLAMLIVSGGLAKMQFIDNATLPAAAYVAAGICLMVCLYDTFLSGKDDTTGKPDKPHED